MALLFFSLLSNRPLILMPMLSIQHDFWDFYVGINAFLRDLNPYLAMRLFTPPSSLLIALPFAFLPWLLAAFLFFCANCILVLVSLTRFCRMIGLNEGDVRRMQAITLCYFPFHFLVAKGNIDGIVLCLVLLAFSSDTISKGVALGLSVAMKLYPALLVVTALRQRRFRLAITASLAALLVQIPFLRLEHAFLKAVAGRGAIVNTFENVGIFILFGFALGSSAKATFLAFWAGTLSLRLYRDRSVYEPCLWVDYIPWMISMPLLIFPYEYVFLLPLIAVFARRFQLGRISRIEGFVFTGFILTGIPSLAFSSQKITEFYGLQLVNAAGLLIILIATAAAPSLPSKVLGDLSD